MSVDFSFDFCALFVMSILLIEYKYTNMFQEVWRTSHKQRLVDRINPEIMLRAKFVLPNTAILREKSLAIIYTEVSHRRSLKHLIFF